MKRCAYLSFAGVVIFLLAWRSLQIPSLNRDWSADQAVLPTISVSGDVVTIQGVRNFRYQSEELYEQSFVARHYRISELKRVWLILERLSSWWRGPAHAMLSFEFEGPEFLVVSAEIRKEKGEQFSPFWGVLRAYELMYVFADERDALALRTNTRKHAVYLYPVEASVEAVRRLFLRVLDRATHLSSEPEFYNTVTNSCITNIVSHLRALSKDGVPWSIAELAPGYADRAAYDMGLFRTDLSLEDFRRQNFITSRAQVVPLDGEFSSRVRQK